MRSGVTEPKREGTSWKQKIRSDTVVLHKSLMSPTYFHLPCFFFRRLSVRLSTFVVNENNEQLRRSCPRDFQHEGSDKESQDQKRIVCVQNI